MGGKLKLILLTALEKQPLTKYNKKNWLRLREYWDRLWMTKLAFSAGGKIVREAFILAVAARVCNFAAELIKVTKFSLYLGLGR